MWCQLRFWESRRNVQDDLPHMADKSVGCHLGMYPGALLFLLSGLLVADLAFSQYKAMFQELETGL